MRCGAPVIGSNATSLPEIIGLAEAMFDPSSVPEMTAMMTRALTDPEFRSRLIGHGRVHARSFSWERTAGTAWRALLELGPRRATLPSPILQIESTALFRRRNLKILVIKLDHLGDFLLAIPALSKLRARYPYASLDIVVGSWNVDLARELRLFSRIESYDFFSRRSTDAPGADESAISDLLGKLGTYDIAIDLRRQIDTRFLLARVSATTKIGYETRLPSIDRHLDVALEIHRDVAFTTTPFNLQPVTAQLLKLVDAIPSDINDYLVFPSIGPVGAMQPGTVAIFPKSGNSAREWQSSRFGELVAMLRGNPKIRGITIYVPYAADSAGLGVTPDAAVTVQVGLTFPELVQSLSRHAVCVANNSGGAHLASYLGLQVIAVFSGHELPSEWAPQFFHGTVIHRAAVCAPCHGKNEAACPNGLFCLQDIAVPDVYALVAEALHAPDPERSSQHDTDLIVRGLLASIGTLRGTPGRKALRELSSAIARNHPDFGQSLLGMPDTR
jgi:ADP-heptose:LPS heptosyltransferase